MTSGRSAFTLVLALLLAGAAAVGVYMYTESSQEADSAAQATLPPPTAGPTTSVLIAVMDIAADTTVTADMVAIQQVSPDAKNARALAAPEEAIGKVTTVTLAQGEQVLRSRLADEVVDRRDASETYAYEVPVGKRAVSVIYDEVIGVGALVQPGDKVDVIGLFAEMSVGDLADSGTPGAPPKVIEVEKDIEAVTYVVQDVEVLAVSQALTSGEAGIVDPNAQPTPTPTPDPDATAEAGAAGAEAGAAAVARPAAKSVTLAVSMEEAQRLLLASQTATLRLALRSPGDTTTNALFAAQSGIVPVDMSNYNTSAIPTDLAITDAEFTRRALTVGEILEFRVTLKNVSVGNVTITTSADATPGFTYNEGTAYDALGFEGEQGTYRLALNVDDAYPTVFPYRWGLGRDVKPGESIEVTGAVKMIEPTTSTQYWFGIILEGGDQPDVVTQDGMGAADIAVSAAAAAVVDARTAELYAEPSEESETTAELSQGDRLTVLETRGEWFRVQTADRVEGWITVGAVEVVPAESAPQATPTGT